MMFSSVATLVGCLVIVGCNLLIDRDIRNVGAWIVLAVATWGTTQNALALGRHLFCGG